MLVVNLILNRLMDINFTIESISALPVWMIYLTIFAFPFVQEDAAVFGAATLSAMGKVSPVPALIAIFLGLFFSDIWKYWIGWAALQNKKGENLSKREKVLALKEKVENHPVSTMMTARFVPLTRIPAYIACGFFRMNYAKFCMLIALTAILYICIIFGVIHWLGIVMADQLKFILPILAIIFVLSVYVFHRYKKAPENPN